KPLIFAINGATPRARITAEAAIALSQHGTVAPVTIHQRTDFAASMIDGRTVMELNAKSPSAAEIGTLWTYIEDKLEKNFRRTVFQSSASQRREAVRQGAFGRRHQQVAV